MEWAKAHTARPLPIELGFSGASHPRGSAFHEHGSGEPELKRLLARKYGVAKDQIYLAGGTSLANFIAIGAFVDRKSTVAVEIPRYAPLAEIPRGLGARVLNIRRDPSGRLARIPERVGLVVLTDPHNPTGRLLSEADWRDLERFADRGGMVVVDEVYRDLQRRPPPVAARRHPRFLTTGSLTKTYGLGALRIGWVLGAPDLLDRVRRVDNVVSVQCATPPALVLKRIWSRLPQLRLRAMRHIARNLGHLRGSALDFIDPQAGLTAFVRVGDGDDASATLERLGIGVARGSFFEAPEYVRLFLGADPGDFRKGVRALEHYCGL
jgi:aspartate/methionine/tyrosine aminotransferase